jgi:muramoyltetrapeptide carboxypeptidase
MSCLIRLVEPSSREVSGLMGQRIYELEQAGFTIRHEPMPVEWRWPVTSASATLRAETLAHALLDPDVEFVLCARGGHGASDLLPLLPWEALRHTRPKTLVGFSDITALHTALYTQLGWTGIHGPVPATRTWPQGREAILDLMLGEIHAGQIAVQPLGPVEKNVVKGWLFGGNLAVLGNLIGTPYFPSSLEGAILFLEDVGESPGRILRIWNQFLQSQVLTGIQAVVVGTLTEMPGSISALEVKQEMARRMPQTPFYSSSDFGHIPKNLPLWIQATAEIQNSTLVWQKGNAPA